MANRVVALVAGFVVMAAFGAASASGGPTGRQSAGAGASGTANSANAELAAMCRAEIGKNFGADDERCTVTQDDCDVLKEVDDANEAAYGQRLDAKGVRALFSAMQPLGGPLAGSALILPYCDQEVCEVPVFVRAKEVGMKRCQAILPFHRYCVRPVKGNATKKPQKISFYLAKIENKKIVKLESKDGFEFAKRDKGPKPYDAEDIDGLYLHEDDGKGKRRPMQKKYFEFGERSSDGLTFTWQVTKDTVNTVGNIGRIPNGLLSAAFVRTAGTTDASDICQPKDPIIVNTAN